MKNIFVTIIALLAFIPSYAGDGDKFINVSGGLMYRNTVNALIAMEFEQKYHSAWEIYLDMTTTYKKCPVDNTIFCEETFWDYKTFSVGGAYKPAFYRSKNFNLRLRVGADLGTDEGYSFCAGIDVGLEATYSFRNRMQVFLTQKNDFIFWTRDNIRNGLLIGIKIPMN